MIPILIYLCSMKNLLILIFLIPISRNIQAQSSLKDSSITHFMVSPGISFQIPGGDLKNRFGVNSAISLSFDYKMKNQFSIGMDGSFLFGNQIKETSILDGLRTSDGDIIDADGNIADILIFERGFTTSFHAGYLLTWKKPNPNSGIFFNAGIGFIQHKIRIEHNNNAIPSLEGDYLKGYDRLTNGILITEFIGYRYLSNKRLLNFFAGIECMQGFTKNRRDYNYDLMGPDNTKRMDLLSGVKIGWILPLYKQAPQEYYYN
jgi:hypothetical protein